MRSQSGIVYILQTPYGVKIGKTTKLEARLKALAKEYDVVFVHAIGTHDINNLERAFHRRFADKRVKGVPSTEIFALSLADIFSIQSLQHFQGKPCKHFTTLTDAVRHSIAVARRYYLQSYGR